MVTAKTDERKSLASKYTAQPSFPRYIGTDNAEPITGKSYRWNRDLARRYGVPIYRHGRVLLIDAPKLFEAIEREAEQVETVSTSEPADPTAAVLAQLGYEARK